MDQPRLALNVLDVPSPCMVPWKSMTGTAQVRFCDQCRKNVYNLSAMTADEANALLAGPETPCVRFYRRFDGTIVTGDRCGNRAGRVWKRIAGGFGALLFSLGVLVGCNDKPSDSGSFTVGKPAPRTGTTTTGTTNIPVTDNAIKDNKRP